MNNNGLFAIALAVVSSGAGIASAYLKTKGEKEAAYWAGAMSFAHLVMMLFFIVTSR